MIKKHLQSIKLLNEKNDSDCSSYTGPRSSRRTGRCSILCRECRGKCMLLFGGSSRVLLNLYAVMLFA